MNISETITLITSLLSIAACIWLAVIVLRNES